MPIVSSSWNDEALAVYEAAMPGYEVLPFTGTWLSTDALHCRVKEVADTGMLHLAHQPVAGEVPYQPTFALDVDVVPYSGQPLTEDELFLIYRVEEAPYDTLALQHAGGDTYAASLPVPQGDVTVSYYFSASDASGRTERFPLVGPEGPRSFYVLPEAGACEQDLSASLDNPSPAPGEVMTFTATVTNDGTSPAPLDLWLDATGPASQTVRLGAGTLPAGATVTRTVRVRVPDAAPAGASTLAVTLGDFAAGDVCDSVAFSVTVGSSVAAGGGTAFEARVPEGDLFASGATTTAPEVVVAPNPFTGRTQIGYTVPAPAEVRLAVYDVLGREVAVLVDGRVEAGAHTAAFDARGLAAGPYVWRLVAGTPARRAG